MVNCPECDAIIDVEEEELDEGEILSCEECGGQFAVAGLIPLELEPVADEFGDEDEEEDDEDEDEDEEFEDFDEGDQDGEDGKEDHWR
jgi:alpha-aminoadipate carrier protein LysW